MKKQTDLEIMHEVFTTLNSENAELELSPVLQGDGWSRQYLTITSTINKAVVEVCHYLDTDTYSITEYEGDYYDAQSDDWRERKYKSAMLLLETLGAEVVE